MRMPAFAIVVFTLVLVGSSELQLQPTKPPVITNDSSFNRMVAAEINKIMSGLTCRVSESTDSNESSLSRQLNEIASKMSSLNCDPLVINATRATLTRIAETLNGTSLANIMNKLDSIEEQLRRDNEIGSSSSHAAESCTEIMNKRSNVPSGYYWVKNAAQHPHVMYCDMTRTCGGITGGWMRVYKLDMTNSSHRCPSGLRQRSDAGKRSCGINSNSPFCSSVSLPSNAFYISKVCGHVKGYQVGSPDTFGRSGPARSPSINGNYLDGVSLTYGNPRHHIWSFAAGLDESPSTYPQFNCPCTDINNQHRATRPPSFVGNDYFCDTGSPHHYSLTTFFRDDPLWDGAGCGALNSCCSFNNPPWFYKQLTRPTIDDLEVRVCRDETSSNEDIAVEVVEVFIQ